MSTERDELALILVNAQRARYSLPPRTTTEHCSANCWIEVDAILAADYRKPRTITTAEEIRGLPALTVVLHDDMESGGRLDAYVVPDDGTVMFKDSEPFHLLNFNGDYIDAEDMPLPLAVVYEVNG